MLSKASVIAFAATVAAADCVPQNKVVAQPFPLQNFTRITLMASVPDPSTWMWNWHPNHKYDGNQSTYQDHVNKIVKCARKKGTPAGNGKKHELIVGLNMGQSPDKYRSALSDWTSFAASMMKLVTDNDFDGVNLDWEVDIDYTVLAEFVKQLRAEFDKVKDTKKYLITLAVGGGYSLDPTKDYVDAYDVMSYGDSGSSCQSRLPGFSSIPLSKVLCGVVVEPHWANGCPGWNSRESTIEKVGVTAKEKMQGIFSFRLDNDHGNGWPNCPCPPSYEGSREMYEAVMNQSGLTQNGDLEGDYVISTYLAVENFMTDLQLSC